MQNDNVKKSLGCIMTEENTEDGVIAAAEFSSGFVAYAYIMTNVVLAITIVGLFVNILWIPFGWIVHKKQLENASLTLTKNGIKILHQYSRFSLPKINKYSKILTEIFKS